ncbi:MAG: cellulose-binding protein [Oscillospiraceae bacterium]|nr:cellulose-binding protein [Oscillospiraceae bacterium]
MKKHRILSVCLCAVLAAALTGCSSEAAVPEYKWSNVAIGGGGYVTGMVYSEAEENLVYARTDIGGAYRWKEDEQRWVAITDHLGADSWNLIGIESIAADPVEANRVYALCGTYMGSKGAILSSEDYGTTWTQTDMPFDCGANNQGRGTGERMMVNPKKNNEIYTGTRNAGLWKSDDYGKTWNEVTSFPSKGNYMQESTSVGIMWVEFDPTSSDIYVGVANTEGNCVYKSSDDGATWEELPANLPGMYPMHADFSADGTLYLAYSNSAGPNSPSTDNKGAVCKYDGSAFTDITPALDDGRYGGFSGVSVDANDPNTVVVSTLYYWSDNGDNLYRTTDGGETWTGLFNTKTGEKNYTMDVTQADWLTWGREEAKTGWWITDVSINPFNSDEVMYGTGATIFCTENMTALGSGTDVTIKFAAYGLEETAVYQMVSPDYKDGEPQLYSIMGDLTGFSHLDVTVGPDDAHFMGSSSGGNPTDLDVAFENANVAVYAVQNRTQPVWMTTDGGTSWNPVENVPEKVEGGKIAVNADGTTFLWTPANTGNSNIYKYSIADGKWFYTKGLGYGAEIAADRVNPNVFYAAYNGMFYISKDAGVNFEATGQMIADNCSIQTVVGQEGDVWLCSGSLVMYSSDSGQNFTNLNDIDFKAIGFGAPEKEGGYPTIYAMGQAGEQGQGIYRSTDKGATWVRINDELHQFGNLTSYISGDSKVFGRVYFATNGRGIVMGDSTFTD